MGTAARMGLVDFLVYNKPSIIVPPDNEGLSGGINILPGNYRA
jgi:hypothetical protein